MIDIVINYDEEKDLFKVYEPSTDTILISKSITEALISLSSYLNKSGLEKSDILNCSDINYHLDSWTMKKIIESNVNLIKRLNTAPSGFSISSQKFGGTSISGNISKKSNFKQDHNGHYQQNSSSFNKGNFSNKKTFGFSGKSGFKSSQKKFKN